MKKREKKKFSGFKKFLIIYPSAFAVLAVIIMIFLYGLLKDYEASEPNNTMEELISQFSEDNIENLLEDNQVELTEFESIDVLKNYFIEKMQGQEISYKRKSGEFTQTTPVYVIMAGENQIAKVTLEAKGKNRHNFVEWQLGEITFADYDGETTEITITAPTDARVMINGVEVSEEYKIGDDTEIQELKNVSEFIGTIYERKYTVKGLLKEPEVTAEQNGEKLNVKKDEKEPSYTVEFRADEALLADQSEHIKTIMESYGKYIINRGNLNTLLSYTKGKAYTYLSDIPAVWAYLYGMTYTYEFKNESVSNLIKYSDNCFSVDVYFDLYVDYKTGNTTNKTSMTYIFINQEGTWYLADFIQHQVEE